MPAGLALLHSLLVTVTPLLILSTCSHARIASSVSGKRGFNPLDVETLSAEDGPPISANAIRDPAYLPAQIGGIIGAYAVSLVLVAITLLSLAKKRREHIHGGNDEVDFADPKGGLHPLQPVQPVPPHLLPEQPQGAIPNFSFPSSPRKAGAEISAAPYVYPTSNLPLGLPGVNPFVDQQVVAVDHAMAQQQLEDMYKHVMEHEEAKQRGVVFDPPTYAASQSRQSSVEKPVSATLSKKDRTKPANLNLSSTRDERSSGSKTSSLLSALKSPKKKSVKGASISSPMMTPQSSTFPRHHDTSSMSSIPPRQYAPPPPPPVPTDQLSTGAGLERQSVTQRNTPEQSPESVQSIDERIGSQLDARRRNHERLGSNGTEPDPVSAVSEHSQVPLVGLPQSPKLGASFPSLPSSPKPGASFSRPNAPTAVRTGGALPLRAYEPTVTSPSAIPQTTKQTVFERKGPLSPGTARTPGTSMPYSPYQPFTPCMPMTPSLVTKEDRRRMKKAVPKTPTMEMVKSSEEIW